MSAATAEAPAKTQEQAKRDEYRKPVVCIGLDILFWYKGDLGPFPAKILDFSDQTVSLVYWTPNATGAMHCTSARHRHDPKNRDIDVQNEGTWDLTDECRAIRKALAGK